MLGIVGFDFVAKGDADSNRRSSSVSITADRDMNALLQNYGCATTALRTYPAV